jgi:hypothetical protein
MAGACASRAAFRLHGAGRLLTVNCGHLTAITAALNMVTMIVGLAIFAAVPIPLALGRRLWDYPALGLAWPAALAAIGLVIFLARTRTRSQHGRRPGANLSK